MISTELVRDIFDELFSVSTIKQLLEIEGLGIYWDEPIFVILTDYLPDSSLIPFGRLVFNVLSWADSSPGILGSSPHVWAQRFLTRLAYIHLEGPLYSEPSDELLDYPLGAPLDFHGYPVV